MQKRKAYKSFLRKINSKKKRKLRRMGIVSSEQVKIQKLHGRIELKQKYSKYTWVKAPKILSLIRNPEGTISFINRVDANFKRKQKIFIDLEDVEEIGHGAIVVLLALMVQFRSNRIPFNGNFSKKGQINTVLRKSGFFHNLANKEFSIQDTYDLSPLSDSIYTHAQKNVNPELSESIIKKASFSIWGEERRCTGVQRIFLELMHNTNNHASINSGEKHWWVSINYKKDENKVCFSFIDFGIGIFESLTNKNKTSKFYNVLNKLKNKWDYGSNAELLRLLLTGEVHQTATDKYYRGKGLPGVFEACKKNSVSNLMIISNNAYSKPEQDLYNELSCNLTGTFIYWELNQNNQNLK